MDNHNWSKVKELSRQCPTVCTSVPLPTAIAPPAQVFFVGAGSGAPCLSRGLNFTLHIQ